MFYLVFNNVGYLKISFLGTIHKMDRFTPLNPKEYVRVTGRTPAAALAHAATPTL